MNFIWGDPGHQRVFTHHWWVSMPIIFGFKPQPKCCEKNPVSCARATRRMHCCAHASFLYLIIYFFTVSILFRRLSNLTERRLIFCVCWGESQYTHPEAPRFLANYHFVALNLVFLCVCLYVRLEWVAKTINVCGELCSTCARSCRT